MRPELHDQLLERELRRRTGGTWQPDRVLSAVRRGIELRPELVSPRPRWAPLAGLLGLLAVLAVLAVALPRLPSGPSAASPTPENQLKVLSTEEFAARLESGELNGTTEPVHGLIGSLVGPPPAGELASWMCPIGAVPPDRACWMGTLADTEPPLHVYSRQVHAVDDGSVDVPQMFPGEDGDWPVWYRPSQPVSGLLLLDVTEAGRVEFAGRVRGDGSARTISVADAVALDVNELNLDEVVLVDGSLHARGWRVVPDCDPPGPGGRRCAEDESWLAPAGEFDESNALQVQPGAYAEFSRGPGDGDHDLGPRRGIYALARRLSLLDCPQNETSCWRWQIVARVHQPASVAADPVEPSPTPVAPASLPPGVIVPTTIECEMLATEVEPDRQLTARVHDATGHVVRCSTSSGIPSDVRAEDFSDLALARNPGGDTSRLEVFIAASSCDRSADLTFWMDPRPSLLVYLPDDVRSCWGDVIYQSILLELGQPVPAADLNLIVRRPDEPGVPTPQVEPGPSPSPTVVECVDLVTSPAQPSPPVRSGIFVDDRAGIVTGCLNLGTSGDSPYPAGVEIAATEGPTNVEVSWPVPMLCDHDPTELRLWSTDNGHLLEVDRLDAGDQPQACRTALGQRSVLLTLAQVIDPQAIDGFLLDDGVAVDSVELDGGNEVFTLTLAAGSREYSAGEPINVAATLAYIGRPGDLVTLAGSGSGLVGFGFEQLDGDLEMYPAYRADCRPYELREGDPLLLPYSKSGGWSPDEPHAGFYERYFAEPELTLPPGRYRIFATASLNRECGGPGVRLGASIVITVR